MQRCGSPELAGRRVSKVSYSGGMQLPQSDCLYFYLWFSLCFVPVCV